MNDSSKAVGHEAVTFITTPVLSCLFAPLPFAVYRTCSVLMRTRWLKQQRRPWRPSTAVLQTNWQYRTPAHCLSSQARQHTSSTHPRSRARSMPQAPSSASSRCRICQWTRWSPLSSGTLRFLAAQAARQSLSCTARLGLSQQRTRPTGKSLPALVIGRTPKVTPSRWISAWQPMGVACRWVAEGV